MNLEPDDSAEAADGSLTLFAKLLVGLLVGGGAAMVVYRWLNHVTDGHWDSVEAVGGLVAVAVLVLTMRLIGHTLRH